MALPRAPQRTTPAFGFSFVERAISEGFARRAFGQSEMAEILRFFYKDQDPECIYCGSGDVRRWDHVVPVKNGGDTILGNMVPACARCDDSKQASDFEEWIDGDAPLSPRNRGIDDTASRVWRIQEYVAHHGYKAQGIAERLDETEWGELQEIQNQVTDGRRRLEQLISNYRARVK